MKQRLCALLVFLPAMLAAQSITGSITGVVTDSSGAVIPATSIVVINTDTNIRVTATTDSSGNYTATPLPRGNYRLEVSAKGFKSLVREGIVLQV